MQDDEGEGEGDKVSDLFKKAKAIGARQGTADDLPTQGAFQGAGRSLAGGPSQVRSPAATCSCNAPGAMLAQLLQLMCCEAATRPIEAMLS